MMELLLGMFGDAEKEKTVFGDNFFSYYFQISKTLIFTYSPNN